MQLKDSHTLIPNLVVAISINGVTVIKHIIIEYEPIVHASIYEAHMDMLRISGLGLVLSCYENFAS